MFCEGLIALLVQSGDLRKHSYMQIGHKIGKCIEIQTLPGRYIDYM